MAKVPFVFMKGRGKGISLTRSQEKFPATLRFITWQTVEAGWEGTTLAMRSNPVKYPSCPCFHVVAKRVNQVISLHPRGSFPCRANIFLQKGSLVPPPPSFQFSQVIMKLSRGVGLVFVFIMWSATWISTNGCFPMSLSLFISQYQRRPQSSRPVLTMLPQMASTEE